MRYLRSTITLLFFGYLTLFSTLLLAEAKDSTVTVYLKSGEVINGEVVSENKEELQLLALGNELTIKKALIKRVASHGAPQPKKYPFKTAIITYRTTLPNIESETILYIDAEKNLWAEESNFGSNFFPDKNKEKSKQRTIAKDDKIYSFNTLTNQIIEGPRDESISSMISEDLFQGQPYDEVPCLDRTCRAYSSSSSLLQGRYLFWGGLLIKHERADKQPDFSKEAIKLEVDVPIDPSVFILPKDAEILTQEEFQKNLEARIQSGLGIDGKLSTYKVEAIDRLAKEDAEFAKKLEDITTNGKYDEKRAYEIYQSYELEQLIEQAKAYGISDEIITKSKEDKITGKFELQNKVWEKEQGLRERAQGFLDAATTFKNNGELEKALEHTSKAVEVLPSSHNLISRARLYTEIGELEKALADYDTARENTYSTRLGNHFGHYAEEQRSDLLHRLGKFTEAIEGYTRAIAHMEEQAAERQKRSEESMKKAGVKEITIDKNKGLSHTLYEKRARSFVKLKDYKKAINDAERALSLTQRKWAKDKIEAFLESIRSMMKEGG